MFARQRALLPCSVSSSAYTRLAEAKAPTTKMAIAKDRIFMRGNPCVRTGGALGAVNQVGHHLSPSSPLKPSGGNKISVIAHASHGIATIAVVLVIRAVMVIKELVRHQGRVGDVGVAYQGRSGTRG